VETKDGYAQQSLFWSYYAMDRAFCISLGRSPVLPDTSINVPPLSTEQTDTLFMLMMCYRVDLGRVQGQVPEQLFSPAAMQVSAEVRSSRADALATKLSNAWQAKPKVHSHASLFTRHTDLCLSPRKRPSKEAGGTIFANDLPCRSDHAPQSFVRCHASCASPM
jgi:hypothetical protein